MDVVTGTSWVLVRIDQMGFGGQHSIHVYFSGDHPERVLGSLPVMSNSYWRRMT